MSRDAALTILMVVAVFVFWARRFWVWPINFTGKDLTGKRLDKRK
jgi:hypothetical protein